MSKSNTTNSKIIRIAGQHGFDAFTVSTNAVAIIIPNTDPSVSLVELCSTTREAFIAIGY